MKRSRGFTLLELLVVIIIIVILASVAIVMASMFLRGQGVRQSAMTIRQTFARARQLAVTQRVIHWVTFYKIAGTNNAGMRLYRDNGDGVLTGWPTPSDPLVENDPIELPRHVDYHLNVSYVGFTPSGTALFPPAYSEVQASSFDAQMAASNPNLIGDVVVKTTDNKYYMCMDIDRAAGKVRRDQFVAK
ncbi:MAG: prepilin-type N-terminal cleavage/methylation domain-containing protein [Planctomycetes bacterium]|nr:prepilin-type N-terminal cleavage/methylation domain-containing protein [Planctomycetota bacterium]